MTTAIQVQGEQRSISDWVGDETWWDPTLLSKCYQNVIAKHYDDAIRVAFICIEDRIRELAGISARDEDGYGARLVNRAFNEKRTDFALRLLRKGVNLESARFFINGAFGLIRNYLAHQLAGHDRETCITVLRAANLILRIIEQGRASVEDLWDTIRRPEEAIAPDAAFQELLKQGPTMLRELLVLRGESIECENQPVIDLIDSNLPTYLSTLRRQRDKRLLWTEIKELLLQMLNHEDIQVRKSVIRYFQFFPDERVSKALCENLGLASEQLEEMTVAVIDTLAILKTPLGRKAIAELLSQDPSPSVKASAIDALGQMGHTRYVVDALTAMLEGTGWLDRKRAITALRKITAREAIPALHRCLADKWEIQVEACEALGSFAEADSAQPLGELLLSASAEDVQRAAARALSEIRTDVSLAYLEQCQRSEVEKTDNDQDKVLLEIIAKAQQKRISLTTEETK